MKKYNNFWYAKHISIAITILFLFFLITTDLTLFGFIILGTIGVIIFKNTRNKPLNKLQNEKE